jgi:hypothetical protein
MKGSLLSVFLSRFVPFFFFLCFYDKKGEKKREKGKGPRSYAEKKKR